MNKASNHIDELIVKSLSGILEPGQEKELADWVNASEMNAIHLSEMEKVWVQSEGAKAFAAVDVEGDFEQFKSRVGMVSKPAVVRRINRSFMRIAAVMIPAMLLLAAYGLYQTTPGFGKWEAYNASEEVGQLTLADQSEVFLNKNSTLIYEKSFNGKYRAIELKGEGYFKVAKNPLKPFVVKVGDTKVKVLGTEFNLDQNKGTGEVTLSVTEGRVLFSSLNDKVEVVAGEKAVCVNGTIQKENLKSNNCIAWMSGSINFNKATLGEVLETVADHFDEVLEIENVSASTERLITTRFENPTLEDVLVELRIHFEKKIEINNNKLIISD